MKVIARYPFQAVPGQPQLSFPAGAEIKVKSSPNNNQGGWVFGMFAGQQGWFPESYVMPATPSSQQPQPSKRSLYQHQQTSYQQQSQPIITQARTESPPRHRTKTTPNVSYTNTTETNEFPALGRERTPSPTPTPNNSNEEDEAFPMMGGIPGDLFEGAPKPVQYTTQPQQQRSGSPSFLKDEPEEAPVDIYRHAPARKRNYFVNEYTPEISVQITSKPVEPTTPTYTPRLTQVSPSPTSTPDFWNMHPGRAPGPRTADQACELDRAFDDLKDEETIQIVPEKKKKSFPYIPKSIKKAAKKTVHAVNSKLH